jgi:hypothetical protein
LIALFLFYILTNSASRLGREGRAGSNPVFPTKSSISNDWSLFTFVMIRNRNVTLTEMKENFDPYNDPTQDPSNYWMNTFYYNPKDKRLLPPKRIAALGWTINFGNPNSVLLLGVLIIVLFFI